jgi:hypothetical protein
MIDVSAVVLTRTREQLRTALGLLAWVMAWVVLPLFSISVGALYGAIVGLATGAYAGAVEAMSDLERLGAAMGVRR